MEIRIAGWDYAHTAALRGPAPEGERASIRYDVMRPGAAFKAMLAGESYHAAEMSLATTYMLADRKDDRLIALPVFPSRLFRQSAFYVSPAVGTPHDLVGRRIGVARYGMTMAVWARGLLQDEWGVSPDAIEWWVAERQPFEPAGLRVQVAGSADELERMAAAGELDGILSAGVPAPFVEGKLRRLFPDLMRAEREYFGRTGLFPIMHTIVVRRRLVDEVPWLAGYLFGRFQAAKEVVLERLRETDASSYPLPWLPAFVQEVQHAMGEDFWPYGLARNRAVLTRFAQYMADQGLTSRVLSPEEVFLSLESGGRAARGDG